MSRRPSLVITKRKILKDPVYKDIIVNKFINNMMYDGKKAIAEKILYDSFLLIKEKTNENPLKVFHQAINNARPYIQIKHIRIGGATYKVPVELNENRQLMVAIKWIIDSARKRSEKTMTLQLTNELLDIIKKQGATIKKREELHRTGEANRAFSHYRW